MSWEQMSAEMPGPGPGALGSCPELTLLLPAGGGLPSLSGLLCPGWGPVEGLQGVPLRGLLEAPCWVPGRTEVLLTEDSHFVPFETYPAVSRGSKKSRGKYRLNNGMNSSPVAKTRLERRAGEEMERLGARVARRSPTGVAFPMGGAAAPRDLLRPHGLVGPNLAQCAQNTSLTKQKWESEMSF